MTIKYLGFEPYWKKHQHNIQKGINSIFASGIFVQGPWVKKVEEFICKYLNIKHCIVVNSGTTALHCAYWVIGQIHPFNSSVITIPTTYIGTIEGTQNSIILVDVDKDTWLMDFKHSNWDWVNKYDIIVSVHLYGLTEDMNKVMQIAKEKEAYIIEDACQAFGAKYKQQYVGTFGHLGCFSFYPTKNLWTCGEGGCIVTNDDKFAELIRAYINHGQESKYDFVLPGGMNYRMSEIQAYLLHYNLSFVSNWNIKRRAIVHMYKQLFNEMQIDVIYPQCSEADNYASYYVFPILIKNRDKIYSYLLNKNINVGIHYSKNIYDILHWDHYRTDCPNAENINHNILSLPVNPYMEGDDVKDICKILQEAICSFQ